MQPEQAATNPFLDNPVSGELAIVLRCSLKFQMKYMVSVFDLWSVYQCWHREDAILLANNSSSLVKSRVSRIIVLDIIHTCWICTAQESDC